MDEQSFSHHIQRDIVKKLISVKSARYAELRPKNIESNLFMYHLQQLIRSGYVEKAETGYQLTPQGKRFADRASLTSLKLRIQPKLITIITVRRADGKWLLLERLHQPFIGSVGFPSGKVHYGEQLAISAARELREKANIDSIELTQRGTFIMLFSNEDAVENHIIGYVFSGEAPIGETTVQQENAFFQTHWGDESELMVENTLLKGHSELLELVKNTPKNQLFFAEHTFTSDF